MATECERAPRETVTAAYYPGVLVITATGEFPETCWKLRISKSPLAIWPPEFTIDRCRTGEVCAEVITPYHVEERFPTNAIPETIVVHDAEEKPRVVNVDVQPDKRGGDLSIQGEFVGYSDRLSYDEALRDAVSQVPVTWEPDMGYFRFTVTDVAGEIGGIAGFQRLSVRIKTDD